MPLCYREGMELSVKERGPLYSYIIRRLFLLLIVLMGASIFVFLMLYLVPGDPAQLIGGPEATQEDLLLIREGFGLHRPLHLQYLSFIGGILQGDFGRSFRTGRPVIHEILPRFYNTIKLSLAGILMSILVGVSAGTFSAVYRNSSLDGISRLSAILGMSLPSFWWGLLLILVFSVRWRLFPMAGYETLAHYVLPSITIGTSASAVIARTTRSTMLEVWRQDYIRTAKSKGLSNYQVVYKHALRNAMIPTLTITALQFGVLLGGQVVTETIFSWPGLGRLLVQSIGRRDLPIIQGGVLLLAGTFAFINLLVDIGYFLLDPRIKYR